MSTGTVTGRSGNKWKSTRHDQYYWLAKEQGYRARSAFKLIQMNKKFNFLSSAKSAIDLCAAPGGWLQVCQKHMPTGSTIIGVDILPIKKIPDVKTFQMDITTEECKNALKKELTDGMVDLVVHDGAPNVGGATWSRDAYQQIELVVHSLRLATHFLRKGGTLVTKVFRSQDYNALLWVLKQFFRETTVTKPASSRNASAEVFVVCQHYLAPSKIDPRLLSPSHIFSAPEDGTIKKVDIFADKVSRNRDGYADDAGSLLISRGSIIDFVEGADPVSYLGMHNSLEWDESSEIYMNHASTKNEVKLLVKDLKVLGKGDFSYLLKWRKKLLAYKKELEAEEEDEEEDKEVEEELTPEEKAAKEEQKLTEQLDGLRQKQADDKRKDKKKKRLKINKEKKKRELNANNKEMDGEEELGLFALDAIRDELSLNTVHRTGEAGEALAYDAMKHDDDNWSGPSDNEIDQDDEGQMEGMADDMDFMYEQFKKRRGIVDHRKRRALGLEDDEDDLSVDDEGDEGDSEEEEEEEEEEENTNPLLMKDAKVEGPSKSDIINRWFERDAFKGSQLDKGKKSNKRKLEAGDSSDEADMDSDSDDEEEEKEQKRPKGKKAKAEARAKAEAKRVAKGDQKKDKKQTKPTAKGAAGGGAASTGAAAGKADDVAVDANEDTSGDDQKEDSGFEEVVMTDYSEDSDAQAEAMAMGTMMLRKKKKESIINNAYNRYAFDDDHLLPDWFKDEEQMHNKGMIPITKEMVEAFKQKERAINSRSCKKVLEAKHRKKKKSEKQFERLKSRANKMADSSETTFKDKMKMFEKVANKKMVKEKRPDKNYVMTKKGGRGKNAKGVKKGNSTKLVDKRMRADQRGMKASAKKQKESKKKDNKRKAVKRAKH